MKGGHNGGSESKGHTNIVTNLEETKQFLRISGFEIWSNGTVKCKSCNGKMDIPSAVNEPKKRGSNLEDSIQRPKESKKRYQNFVK